ncbi:hypothetical protein HDV06_006130 [Boothiomyces sp. JEL0866]|nr:hypothetical protein HDV06_006130 [Boothiomyces sp. JEL0866]
MTLRLILAQLPAYDVHKDIRFAFLDTLTVIQGYGTEYFLALVNIQTLDILKVLDSRITKQRLIGLVIFFAVIGILTMVMQLLSIYHSEYAGIFLFTILITSMMLLLFDNFMGIYLSMIVIQRIKSQQVSKSKIFKEKVMLVVSNLCIVLVGWLTAYFFRVIYQSNLDTKSTMNLYYIQYSLMCFHNSLQIIMFIKFKELVLIKKKKPAIKAPIEAPHGTTQKLIDDTVKA